MTRSAQRAAEHNTRTQKLWFSVTVHNMFGRCIDYMYSMFVCILLLIIMCTTYTHTYTENSTFAYAIHTCMRMFITCTGHSENSNQRDQQQQRQQRRRRRASEKRCLSARRHTHTHNEAMPRRVVAQRRRQEKHTSRDDGRHRFFVCCRQWQCWCASASARVYICCVYRNHVKHNNILYQLLLCMDYT